MRRVAVTGLGAVTPLGLDAQSTWDEAVAGRSGVDWIQSFDATGYPVRIASEVKGFDQRPWWARRMRGGWSATSCSRSPLRARRGRTRTWTASTRLAPASSSVRRSAESWASSRRTRSGVPGADRLAVVPAECPGRLREWSDRHRSRTTWPELRTRLGVCDRLAFRRGGRGDDPAGRCGRRPGGRHRVLHAPGDPRRVLRDARTRGGGGGSDARFEAVRRDARRVRHGRGRVRSAPGGPRARAGPWCTGVRGGARLWHVQRRSPHGAARSRVGRRRGDDAGRARPSRSRARAGRIHQCTRDVDAAGRPRRDEGGQGRVRSHAYELAISSTKSVLGHLFGAAGRSRR